MHEIVCTLKAALQKERGDARDWVGLVPAVRENWTPLPESAVRAHHTMSCSAMHRARPTPQWYRQVGGTAKSMCLTKKLCSRMVESLVEEQQVMHEKVPQSVKKNREL